MVDLLLGSNYALDTNCWCITVLYVKLVKVSLW
jgi:hypothetical protein